MSTITLKKSPLFRFVAFTVLVAFIGLLPAQPSYAQVTIVMPPPGQMIHITNHFEPPQMIGLKINLKDPFSFDFIMDQGESQMSDEDQQLEFNKIIKYFLVSLAMPNRDMWVNLSPYESNHIIPEVFGQTEMGRDLLAQDYILKQFTASLMYPEDGLGKEFWSKVYAEAQSRFGTTDINVNTFNKVWIVADKADIYQKDDTAFLVKSHLRVMLEQDFMAIEKNKEQFGNAQALEVQDMDAKTKMASNIVREIIIPAIEKEVNDGKAFAAVRQAYNAEIMATWFKKTLRQSLLGQVFANKSKIAGQRVSDPQAEEKIYQEYLRAYKKGVFNYIKEDATPDGQMIPRKYFSGGFVQVQAENIEPTITPAMVAQNPADAAMVSRFAQAATQRINRYAVAAVNFATMNRRPIVNPGLHLVQQEEPAPTEQELEAVQGPSETELNIEAAAEVNTLTGEGIPQPEAVEAVQAGTKGTVIEINKQRSETVQRVIENLPKSEAYAGEVQELTGLLHQWASTQDFDIQPRLLPLWQKLDAAAQKERTAAEAPAVVANIPVVESKSAELSQQRGQLDELNVELARIQHSLAVFTNSPVQDKDTAFLIKNYNDKINGTETTPGLLKQISDLNTGIQGLEAQITALRTPAEQQTSLPETAPVPTPAAVEPGFTGKALLQLAALKNEALPQAQNAVLAAQQRRSAALRIQPNLIPGQDSNPTPEQKDRIIKGIDNQIAQANQNLLNLQGQVAELATRIINGYAAERTAAAGNPEQLQALAPLAPEVNLLTLDTHKDTVLSAKQNQVQQLQAKVDGLARSFAAELTNPENTPERQNYFAGLNVLEALTGKSAEVLTRDNPEDIKVAANYVATNRDKPDFNAQTYFEQAIANAPVHSEIGTLNNEITQLNGYESTKNEVSATVNRVQGIERNIERSVEQEAGLMKTHLNTIQAEQNSLRSFIENLRKTSGDLEQQIPAIANEINARNGVQDASTEGVVKEYYDQAKQKEAEFNARGMFSDKNPEVEAVFSGNSPDSLDNRLVALVNTEKLLGTDQQESLRRARDERDQLNRELSDEREKLSAVHDQLSNLADMVNRSNQPIPTERNVGGINLSDEHQTINIKVDGAGMPLPAQFQDKSMLNLSGLTSIIRSISPVTPQNVPAIFNLLK